MTNAVNLANAAPSINGSSGNLTITGSMVAGSSYAWRNRIINGDMRIDQRNAGASVTTPGNSQYTVDRWTAFCISNFSKFTVQQNAASVTPPSGFSYYLGATSTSAYSVVASDGFMLRQYIEGFNWADMAYGTASAQTTTLSFWVRSSLTGTFGGSISNYANTRSYVFSYTISAANTWEYKTVTIPGDTGGTWVGASANGATTVNFCIGAGSTYLGTAGSWQGSYLVGPTGQTSVVGTNGATFYLTGVQLEVGTAATPFERRDYGRELIMCQRYYIRTPDAERALKRNYNWSGTVIAINVSADFPVTMRASPTMSVFGDISDGSQISLGGAGLSSTVYTFTAYTNVSNGQFLDFHYYIASAEL